MFSTRLRLLPSFHSSFLYHFFQFFCQSHPIARSHRSEVSIPEAIFEKRGESDGELWFFFTDKEMESKTLSDEAIGSGDASNHRFTKVNAPKMPRKAVREKRKREHLNDIFTQLANALELSLSQQNNGKAFIICEATRFLKDMLDQIESLRKENASLHSESHYVAMEKNELKEETSTLETEISELKTEIEARMNHPKPGFNTHQQPELATHFSGLPVFQQQAASPATVLFLPIQQPNLHQTHDISEAQAQTNTKSSNVSKPQPRYASVADSWPSQLLGERLKASE